MLGTGRREEGTRGEGGEERGRRYGGGEGDYILIARLSPPE